NMIGLMERNAADIATRSPLTAPMDMLASRALALLNEQKINVLIVCDENIPVGVLHVQDLLRAGVA
ncbi:MAG: CBS domain-containing protein, partial [Pseudomonadota bacterium]